MIGVARDDHSSREAGFGLVELLVVISLFSAFSLSVLTLVLSSNRGAETSRMYNDLNGEARVVLNRMSRELREASRITSVTNPVGPGYSSEADTSVTFEVDFNGNGTIEPTAVDPEVLTYTYRRAERQLLLSAGGGSFPVLAANVEVFKLSFAARTSDARLQYDGLSPVTTSGSCAATPATGSKDGVIHWTEIDAAAGLGNCNAALDTTAERQLIASVAVELTVLQEPREQEYRTTIDLRNVST